MLSSLPMDPHSTVDRNAAAPEIKNNGGETLAHASVSAGIAAANAQLPGLAEPGSHAPAEETSPSLSEMAHRDLDATLQLLAERAQYITAASGAAIATARERARN